ncbi:hypothetical protein L1987_43832 [Smallanthus sonchifolius]|uniref:Uncharacterized protein n=1 Tax=Smallanthus sonchifolius TaxID=185202 RepID=A0ACB9GMV5_9ASTR|nr:hypothetical protein L1987_43832 [Smallanthus sonchifolius]
MQLQGETDDLGFCLSFDCYFSDSLTASAAAKVISEFKQEHAAQFYEFSDVDEEDFEFSPELSDEEVSGNQIHVEHPQFIFPVSDSFVEETGDCSSVSIQLQKPYGDEHEYSSSFSSCEVDENECKPSGIFCMWRWKADVVFAKSKKSSSAGSGSHGSRRWKILSSLRRSNTEEVTGKLKTTTSSSPSFHELFYVKRRAEQKDDKMKSFLPYKQDLLGFRAGGDGNQPPWGLSKEEERDVDDNTIGGNCGNIGCDGSGAADSGQGDAGFDCYVSGDLVMRSNGGPEEFTLIPFGLAKVVKRGSCDV